MSFKYLIVAVALAAFHFAIPSDVGAAPRTNNVPTDADASRPAAEGDTSATAPGDIVVNGIPKDARPGWYEASSKHFVVYANGAPQQLLDFTRQLERYDSAIRAMRGVKDMNRGAPSRVTVFQVADVTAIQKLSGPGIAGFYQPRSSGAMAFVPRTSGDSGAPWELDARRILLHEYAHHFMFADWPERIFPRWFAEGFAEYNSTAIFNKDGSVIFGAPPTDRGWGVADQNNMPLSKMLDPGIARLGGRETYALYARGWALTHYLTQTPERRKMLSDYIAAITAGKPLDEAKKQLGDINALDFALVSYVKRPKFASQLVPADKISTGDIAIRALGAGEAATMPVRIRSQAGVDAEKAKHVVVDARAAAAPYPADAAAQNVLAEAEYDAGNFDASASAADRAIAADPKSVHALVYKGMALQAIAEKAKSTDAKQWTEVRRWYIAANRAATEDPYPLILYYRSYKPAGQMPTASAEKGLLYAVALAPYDLSLRPEAAHIYLARDDGAEAKRALQAYAFNPHGGKVAEKMRAVIATIDTGGAKPALAQLDATMKEQGAEAAKTGNKKDDGDGD